MIKVSNDTESVADNNRHGELCMGNRIISAEELADKEFDECVYEEDDGRICFLREGVLHTI